MVLHYRFLLYFCIPCTHFLIYILCLWQLNSLVCPARVLSCVKHICILWANKMIDDWLTMAFYTAALQWGFIVLKWAIQCWELWFGLGATLCNWCCQCWTVRAGTARDHSDYSYCYYTKPTMIAIKRIRRKISNLPFTEMFKVSWKYFSTCWTVIWAFCELIANIVHIWWTFSDIKQPYLKF